MFVIFGVEALSTVDFVKLGISPNKSHFSLEIVCNPNDCFAIFTADLERKAAYGVEFLTMQELDPLYNPDKIIEID